MPPSSGVLFSTPSLSQELADLCRHGLCATEARWQPGRLYIQVIPRAVSLTAQNSLKVSKQAQALAQAMVMRQLWGTISLASRAKKWEISNQQQQFEAAESHEEVSRVYSYI